MKDLTQNQKWQPTKKLWYSKYQYAITLGPFTPENAVTIEKPYRSRSQWLFNKELKSYEVFTTFYLDSIDFLKGLMKSYPYTEVHTPMNEKHEEILKDNRKHIRDKLWHGKYRYKLDMWPLHRIYPYNRAEIDEAKKEITTVLLEIFESDSHIRRANWGWGDLPYIYTNNEKGLMIVKLRYSDILNISITEAITFDEILQLV